MPIFIRYFAVVLVFPVLCGCPDASRLPGGGSDAPPPTTSTEAAPAEATSAADQATDGTSATIPPASEPEASQQAPPAASVESTEPNATQQVEATAGVGQRGQSLEPGNLITEPARAFFRVEQRLVFQQVEQALQLYKATEGRFPQSTEQFMQEIVEPNRIQLPELPEGHRYLFDPEQGKLMVERPST